MTLECVTPTLLAFKLLLLSMLFFFQAEDGIRDYKVTGVQFFFSSRSRHTRLQGDWSSDVCSSDLPSSGCAITTTAASVSNAGCESIGRTSGSRASIGTAA